MVLVYTSHSPYLLLLPGIIFFLFNLLLGQDHPVLTGVLQQRWPRLGVTGGGRAYPTCQSCAKLPLTLQSPPGLLHIAQAFSDPLTCSMPKANLPPLPVFQVQKCEAKFPAPRALSLRRREKRQLAHIRGQGE